MTDLSDPHCFMEEAQIIGIFTIGFNADSNSNPIQQNPFRSAQWHKYCQYWNYFLKNSAFPAYSNCKTYKYQCQYMKNTRCNYFKTVTLYPFLQPQSRV